MSIEDKTEISQKHLIILVFIIEGILFAVSLLWGYLARINPFKDIYFDSRQVLFAILASTLVLFVNFLVINEFSKYIPFFEKLKKAYNEIAVIASDVSIVGALFIAIMSGFAEEFFFRGILQEQFGIVVASIIFGLFHIGNAKTLYYGLYAIFIGFYLGWLYIFTGNLLVPILVHIINNFLALPYMRYYYDKYIRENNA